MTDLIHPRLQRRKVINRFIEEIILSAAVWLPAIVFDTSSDKLPALAGAWLALSILTSISNYTGQLVRVECHDLRYMMLSIYKKIPDYVLWTFWPTVVAVLIAPLFAFFAYAALLLAFYRGFWFRNHCMGYRFITLIDIFVRICAGMVLVVV